MKIGKKNQYYFVEIKHVYTFSNLLFQNTSNVKLRKDMTEYVLLSTFCLQQ